MTLRRPTGAVKRCPASSFQRASAKQKNNVQAMNTEIIAETSRATLAGAISFPEVVKNLLGTGVEYYHVDYVALEKTFYSGTGDHVTTPITYEGLPPVGRDFDAAAEDDVPAQQNNQSHSQSA